MPAILTSVTPHLGSRGIATESHHPPRCRRTVDISIGPPSLTPEFQLCSLRTFCSALSSHEPHPLCRCASEEPLAVPNDMLSRSFRLLTCVANATSLPKLCSLIAGKSLMLLSWLRISCSGRPYLKRSCSITAFALLGWINSDFTDLRASSFNAFRNLWLFSRSVQPYTCVVSVTRSRILASPPASLQSNAVGPWYR